MRKSCSYRSIFDIPKKELDFNQLINESEKPNFWQNTDYAQSVMRKVSLLKDEIEPWQTIKHRVCDALEFAQLEDSSLLSDLEIEADSIENDLNQREFYAMFSGQYDRGNALLAIHAGAGGTDSQDWAEMLQRMYLRWSEINGFEMEILDLSEGEEAGIKSVTIAVEGKYAYGYLKSEKGVHRLVRLSPYDAAHRRHTSFAMVEILPQVDDDSTIEIKPNDLRIDTYRSAGAGGQNVQKNDTAVRITHIPSGIVVTCQNERSQTQNRENAIKVLKARLLEIKQREQEEHLSELRGDFQKMEWGSQIRSYVLHPYQMVKDHRTDCETGNAQAVLNGDINNFIDAYLRANVGKK